MMESAVYKALQKDEKTILSKWQSAAFSHGNHDLLAGQKQKGRFSDPMAYVIEKNTREILDWLIKPDLAFDLAVPLEEICRLKAVQDIRPSAALKFIFDLKIVIREALANENQMDVFADEQWQIDQRIDEMTLLAFDLFSACRTQIYELRVKEIKRMVGRDVG